jgi:predicted membrane-bound dolichyl-phosphate-mannose-protein mannosyltransferase
VRIAKILSALGALIMLGAIVSGFMTGDFNAEGSILLSIAWGRITLIDIYVSFFVFCGWVIFRERSWWRSIIWIALVIVLGSLTICTYTFLALQASGGSCHRFWFGRRAQEAA